MSRYLMDCKKCTNKYIGMVNGEPVEWCRPMVDTGKSCLEVEGNGKEDFTFKCEHFMTEEVQGLLRFLGV